MPGDGKITVIHPELHGRAFLGFENWELEMTFIFIISSSRKGLDVVYLVLIKETKNHVQAHNQG
jgi:hypothetical protein